jgi:hypothetical protein
LTAGFRCAAASLARGEPLLATASTVRAFVLVEFSGAWGRDAVRDARLPAAVRDQLLELSELGVKALLIRRHGRAVSGSKAQVFVASCGPGTRWLEGAQLESLEQLADIDLVPVSRDRRVGLERRSEPLAGVCTHGRHDTCCAEQGRPLAASLSRSHRELAWEMSHIGGDRFAANVLILPDGLYYGRVLPADGPRLLDEHLTGRLDLDHLRGRSAFPLPAQAAEIFLRRRLGEVGLDAVRLVAVRRAGDDWTVDLEVAGQVWRCGVVAGRGEAEQLTCAVSRLSRPPTFEDAGAVAVT